MKRERRYIYLLVLTGLIVLFSVNLSYAQFAGGSGTEQDPYLVATAEHLSNIRDYTGDINNRYYFLQIADIDLGVPPWNSGEGWVPIGNGANSFYGSYDGAGYSITGLTIDRPEGYNQGLFGHATGAELKNINLSGADITGLENVGGLIGNAQSNTEIDNCHVEVILRSSSDEDIIGGLVGNLGHSMISNSSAHCDISGYRYIGGLVGDSYNGKIFSSFSTGNISAHGYAVGGLVGRNYSIDDQDPCMIANSYSSCRVEGASNGNVGGLVGMNMTYSIIINSYSTGMVNDGISEENVGGLTGSNNGVVIDSFWDMVTSKQETSSGGEGKMTIELLRETNSCYTEWDFEEVWAMEDYTTYPYLCWQVNPGVFNYPHNGYHKKFARRSYYWESFPVLWDRDQSGNQSGQEVLDPLTYHDFIEVINEESDFMFWNGDSWDPQDISFHSTRGYQISFGTEEEFDLIVQGDTGTPTNIAFNTTLTIYYDRESWLGYFIPQRQNVFSAFGSTVMDDLQYIQAETWGMYRIGTPDTLYWAYQPGSTKPYLEYGKMYRVGTRREVGSNIDFTWQLPVHSSTEYIRPEPEFFDYTEGPAYESIFIEEIADDEDVLEVAVYAGDECVGASVFLGGYPLEILAYTNETHLGEELTFAIQRGDQRGEPVRIQQAEVRDIASGEYNFKPIKPLRQRFSIVRLGSEEGGVETIYRPEVSLYQNYPNPVSHNMLSRSDLTQIPFYVSETREVTLTIYNIKGQLVKTLFTGQVNEGKHTIGWNGLNDQNRQVGSGIYFYRLVSGYEAITRKMLLIR